MNINKETLVKELVFKTSRSGGKGGQHVNKVSTKVEIKFDIHHSSLLNEDQKQLLFNKLQHRLDKEGMLQVTCSKERSQLLNKLEAIEKMVHLLQQSLEVQKPRKDTKPTKGSVERRLQKKKVKSEKKAMRSRSGWE